MKDISTALRNDFSFEEETPKEVSIERIIVGDVVDIVYDNGCHKTLIYGGCVKGVNCYYDPIGKCIIIPENLWHAPWKIGHIKPRKLKKILLN